MKWATPDGEVEYLHHNISDRSICGRALDDKILPEILRQAPVEDEETAFRSPLYGAHALLDQ